MGFIRKFPSFSSRGRKENLRDTLLQSRDSFRSGKKVSVPKGHVAVYVGEEMRRFVIPASYLCLPPLKELMERVAEEFEFGFGHEGGLRIPCEEEAFEEIIRVLDLRSRKNKSR